MLGAARCACGPNCLHGFALATHCTAALRVSVQAARIPIDIVHPEDSAVVTGTLVTSLEWIPLNPSPVAPPQRLPLLTEVGRGTFFVRLVCAWDLPPADMAEMSCNARVSILSTGRQQFTSSVRSMCPVWIETARFEYVSELGEVWLEVQHVGQVRVTCRCTPMPNWHPFLEREGQRSRGCKRGVKFVCTCSHVCMQS